MDQGSSGAASSRQPDDQVIANRRERIRAIVATAIRQPSEGLASFLEQACGGDASLHAEIELLLKADASTVTVKYALPSGHFPPGKELAGRFRIVRFIASGGMSDVYEADHLQLGEHVALKTIRPEIIDNANTLSRFKREVQYAKRVTHPNVCRIHDFESHRDGGSEVVFLTMELLRGETLAAHLRATGRMSTGDALPLLAQMTEALAAAHDANVIHRDFKPSNVMLTGTTLPRRTVITDFGLSRSSLAGDDGSLTGTGKLAGTPAYMAPEQLLASEVTPATDVYALGLVMYEMVTGQRPFRGKTQVDSMMMRLREPPPPPSDHVPGLDPRWEAVILRCLEREPARRFQSARDVGHALAIPVPPVSSTLRRLEAIGQKKSTRATAAVIAGAAILLCILYGVWTVGRHRPSAVALRWYAEGTGALRDGTSFKAMKSLEQAVAIDPGFSLAHARLAEAATDLDYTDRAASEMLHASPPALQSFFLSAEEKLRLEAVYFVLVKDFPQAVVKYKQLAAKVPSAERASVLVDLGRAYESALKTTEALATYSESIARDDQFAAAFLRRATLEGRQQLNAGAVADFDKADHLYRLEGNGEGITEVLYQRSVLFRRSGKFADARTAAEKVLEMARDSHDEYHQIRALLMLSSLLSSSGDTDAAQQRAQEGIDLARSAGIEILAASGLVDVGNALFNKGDNAGAETYLNNALETAKRFHSLRVEARAELTLGQVMVKTDRTGEGLALLKHAIGDYEKSGDKGNAARAAIPIARTFRDHGEFDAAGRLFQDQLQLAERVKDDQGIALAAQGVGGVLFDREKYPAALPNFERSAQVSLANGDVSTAAYSDVNRADALWALGRYNEAAESLEAAEGLAQRLNGNKRLLAVLNTSRAAMDLSRLSFGDVEKDVRGVMDNSAFSGPLEAWQKMMLGLQRVGTGRTREGLALCEASVERARASGNLLSLKTSELALAEARLKSGNVAGALALASGLAEYYGGTGQNESLLRALALAISASQGTDRARYLEKARASLQKLQTDFGDAFGGFALRPDIRQIIQQAGLT